MNSFKFYVLALFLMCYYPAQGQDSQYFPNNTVWQEVYANKPDGPILLSVVLGDTIVDSKNYKIVNRMTLGTTHYEYFGDWKYLIREEGNQIYFRNYYAPSPDPDDHLALDFDWEPGKEILCGYSSCRMTVTDDNVGQMVLDDGNVYDYLKTDSTKDRYYNDYPFRGVNMQVIKGIGCPKYGLIRVTRYERPYIIRLRLVSFNRNGVDIISYDKTEGIKDMQMSPVTPHVNTYNLKGEKIPFGSRLPKGIYIRNGKKLVVH